MAGVAPGDPLGNSGGDTGRGREMVAITICCHGVRVHVLVSGAVEGGRSSSFGCGVVIIMSAVDGERESD